MGVSTVLNLGDEIEAPKASRRWGMGRGFPQVWGSVVSSPSGVRGRTPAN